MRSDYKEPLNIGSEQLVSINELVDYFISLKHKNEKKYVPGPQVFTQEPQIMI